MAEPADNTEARRHFLDVEGAEVVDGPDVIAGKVRGALKDADRFGMPNVKPPLSEALSEVRRADGSAAAAGGPAEQSALAGESAEVDERAGSAEVLKPAEKDPA